MTSAPKWYPSPLLDYEARGSNPTFQPLASVKNIVYFCDAKSRETVDAVSFQPTASILFAKHGSGRRIRIIRTSENAVKYSHGNPAFAMVSSFRRQML